MGRYRLRSDLDRAVINGFALPLGIAPGKLEAPMSGYTIAYATGVDDEPDTYSFYVAVSHERIAPTGESCAVRPMKISAIMMGSPISRMQTR